MIYEVNFNNVPLHEYLIITGVERSILPPRKNNTVKINSMFGEVYNGYTYNSRTITISCFLEADSEEDRVDKMSILSNILHVSEPVKISINDNPGKYVYGIPDGEIKLNKLGFSSEFKIKIVCFDVYTYADEPDYFTADENGVVNIVNLGSVEASPITKVEFLNKADFLQITNENEETILIGSRPGIDDEVIEDDLIIDDPCDTMTEWVKSPNSVDGTFYDIGTAQVNGGGYGIICGDYGQQTEDDSNNFMKGWHGVSLKRSLPRTVENFDISFYLEHNSYGDVKGVGAGTQPPVSSAKYVTTGNPTLNIREDRTTKSRILGKIPNGTVVTVTDIDKGWGKVTYKDVTGYISMNYTKVYQESTVSGDIQSTGDVYVRSGAGTKYKILTVAKKGTVASILGSSGSWYKVKVNGKTGYSHKNYWKKITPKLLNEFSAEHRMGRIEVYGYDNSGRKIFKCVLKDVDQFYENTQPEIWAGNYTILKDSNAIPVATDKDSGKFGSWNEFAGIFNIKRQTIDGVKYWSASISKYENGNLVKSIESSLQTHANFPEGDLAYLIVSFGQYKNLPVVDSMNISSVVLREIKPVADGELKKLFWAGDELVIDHDRHKVYLNGMPYMEDLDIGSKFFKCDVGNSAFRVFSNTDIDISTTITRKWLD